MITTIKEFKDKLNENLLISRRSKDERNTKLWQQRFKLLCDNEIIENEKQFIIDYGFDFPSNFNLNLIKLKTITGNVRLNLNHIPKWLQNVTINGYFDFFGNKITSLQYCPTVKGSFYCQNNNLISLKYCPTTVNGDFYCYANKLTTLEHAPTTVNGGFDCSINAKKFTHDEVKEVSKVFGKIYV